MVSEGSRARNSDRMLITPTQNITYGDVYILYYGTHKIFKQNNAVVDAKHEFRVSPKSKKGNRLRR